MELPYFLKSLAGSFMKNDILSVDIGFTNTKVVHARKKSPGLLRVMNYGIEQTPQGCIKNGIICDLDGIAENLKKAVEGSGINEKNVKIVISAGSNIVSKVLFVPTGDGRHIEEKIRSAITGQIPVDIFAQKLFYRVIDDPDCARDGLSKVLVTIVPNSVIDNYMKLMRLLNFNPVAIEIPFSSVARFFNKGAMIAGHSGKYYTGSMLKIDRGATAVIDLGSETTNLSVLNNGALEFNRIVLAGGRNLDDIISRKLDVRRELARMYKEMHGIPEQWHTGDEIERVVGESVRDYLGEILRNVKRSLSFYVERCGGQTVERVFFIGGGSGLKGLCSFAQEVLGVKVYTVDMIEFKNLEFESNLNTDKIRFLINALGIAM
ncbi:MAG: pilus assembly protein PilM [Clostridia bacterium]|nr:pilus assembly protein PilM [Clostridia bacterium]